MSRDYIPRHDADFNNWFRNLAQYVVVKTTGATPEWKHILSDDVTELNQRYAAWYDAFAVTLKPHTPADTAAKNNARAAAERVIRPFVQRYLHFPPVTDSDRINMSIPNRDLVRTPHKEVGELVDYVLHLRGIREIIVDFWIMGQTHKAKPQGYDGAVLVWDVLPAPPARPDDLNRHTMASRTPHTLTFDETERGRTVYIALAWQNERGNIGEWSEIKSAVIP